MGGSMEKSLGAEYDVLIVGSGLSGINAAYRVQTQLPGASYTILESRGAKGGTWDLFRYPGIRSDSDLHTFGFPWRPWDGKPIADADSIRKYIAETTAETGIDNHIQYHHRVVSADWSTPEQKWILTAVHDGVTKTFKARFLILGTGYYDYDAPLEAKIPGLENFKGTVIHPQFWPEDLDYTNKNIAIIGSGATAVTLLPNLAEKAARVTMIQRSPGYMISLPNSAKPSLLSRIVPVWLTRRFLRLRFLIVPFLFFRFCRAYPNAARKLLRAMTKQQLPKEMPLDPHFAPSYNPWEQRLCVAPDGDFFKALRKGKADIVTGHIKTISDDSILMQENDQKIKADILVTATGLKIQIAGGMKIALDGKPLNAADKFMWKGMMLQDVPNMTVVLGYTNASWTLGADATAQHVTRLINTMNAQGYTRATPRLHHPEQIKPSPLLNLNSTYVVSASDRIPKAGDKGPWKARDNYFVDIYQAKYGDINEEMEFARHSGETQLEQARAHL